MARQFSDWTYSIKPEDLKDKSLARLNRGFQYLWQTFQGLLGDGDATHFLNGEGNYQTPLSSEFPAKHTSPGQPGQVAFDSNGAFYFCYRTDNWARIDATGYSNTF